MLAIHGLFPQSHIFRKIKISSGFHMLQNQFHALSDELACCGLHPNSFEMSARPSPVDVLLISTPGLLKTSTCYILRTSVGRPFLDIQNASSAARPVNHRSGTWTFGSSSDVVRIFVVHWVTLRAVLLAL